jgi:hypothetical protein
MNSRQLNGNQVLVGTSSDGFFGTSPTNINVPNVLSTDTVPDAIDKLIGIIDLLAPAKSPRLDSKFLSFISGGPTYPARHVAVGPGSNANFVFDGTNTVTQSATTASLYSNVIFSNRPTVRVSDSTSGTVLATFSDGQSGVLQSFIDNSIVGFRTLNGNYHASGDGTSVDVGGWDINGNNTGPNSLFITFDQDPFSVAPNAGFWTSLKATMSATSPFSTLDGVEHYYQMRHTKTGNTPAFKFICDTGDFVYPGNIPFSDIPTFAIGKQNPSVTRWVSGVPGLTVGDYMIASYTFSNAPVSGRYPLISRFYNQTRITAFVISDGSNSSTKNDLDTNGFPIIGGTSAPYAFQPNWVVRGITAAVIGGMFTPSTMTPTPYSLNLFVRAYNPKNDLMNSAVYQYANYGGPPSSQVYVDTVSIEGTISGSTRVRSGNGVYPSFGSGNSQFGEDYSPTFNNVSIRGNDETVASELMLQNGKFQWPVGNYTSNVPTPGDDYSTLVTIFNSPAGVRFATFNVGTINAASSMTINIVGGVNFGTAPVVSGFSLQCIIMNGSLPVTGWLDINSAYLGVGQPSNNGDAALDLNLSTPTTKRVTFGSPSTRTGTVYIRAGLPTSSTKTFTNITKS